jgi:hypothetical protein
VHFRSAEQAQRRFILILNIILPHSQKFSADTLLLKFFASGKIAEIADGIFLFSPAVPQTGYILTPLHRNKLAVNTSVGGTAAQTVPHHLRITALRGFVFHIFTKSLSGCCGGGRIDNSRNKGMICYFSDIHNIFS